MEQQIQVVNVREAVNAVLLTLEPQLVAKRLDSVGDVPPDVCALADPAKLRGILLTLLTNAIRFTSPGGFVMVDVGYPLDMTEDVVMLRIGDSGRGIARERQAEIFEPPTQPRDGVSERGPGVAVSREWARSMNGDLRVRSEVERGSVFTLTLPRARDTAR